MSKAILIIVIILTVVLAGVFIAAKKDFFQNMISQKIGENRWICQNGQWVKRGNPESSMPTAPCGNQTSEINNFNDCLKAGYPIMESYPRQCKTPDGRNFTEDIGNELVKINLIKINSPRPNQMIVSPLTIEGEARGYWFFEASFPVKLLNEKGEVIAQTIAQAQGEWMTENFAPFKAVLAFKSPAEGRGWLVLQKDNPSGLPENDDELKIPVFFGTGGQAELIKVKVYFNNNKLDPDVSCNKVFPVDREIAKTSAVARAALEELLKGSDGREKSQGFFTSINENVKINSLKIENNIAKVDFNGQLEFQVGGSCRVSAIRAQIEETLKQFPTVKSVIISVNGRTEDILQP